MRLSRRTLLAFACIAAAGLLPGQESRPTQQDRKSVGAQQQAFTDQRGTEKAPVVVKVLPAPQTQEEAAKVQAERNENASSKRWNIRLTVALVVIAFGQLVVFGFQAHRLRQTVEKMDEIARGQAADTRASIAESARAATAMEQSAKAAEGSGETFLRQLEVAKNAERPWIGFHEFKTSAANPPFDAFVEVVNAGKSPALILSWTGNYEYLSSDTTVVTHPSPERAYGYTRMVLIPGMPIGITIPVEHQFDVLGKRFNIRGERLHVFSRIRYEDLRDGIVHSTWACWRWIGGGTGDYCPDYNGAD